jgi:magnesium-transporting ATPase (P-type)
VVQRLKAMDIEVWMVTGDNHKTATTVASQLGITNVQTTKTILTQHFIDFVSFLYSVHLFHPSFDFGIHGSFVYRFFLKYYHNSKGIKSENFKRLVEP